VLAEHYYAGRKTSVVRLRDKNNKIDFYIEHTYPDLTVTCEKDKIYIRGAFPIVHEGKVLTRYQVEIEWSDSDTEAPVLRETGGRVPWTDNRHVDNATGQACSIVQEEWLLRPQSERSVLHYLDGPVRDFFIAQSVVEQDDPWPWEDRKHGVSGLLQAYGEMTGLQDEAAIRLCLSHLCRETVTGRLQCPHCGAKRIRDCHVERLRELHAKIPPHIAKLALLRIRNPRMR